MDRQPLLPPRHDVVERCPRRPAALVGQDCMPLVEGAPFHILPCQPNVIMTAVEAQGGVKVLPSRGGDPAGDGDAAAGRQRVAWRQHAPVQQQRAKRQRLGGREVDAAAGVFDARPVARVFRRGGVRGYGGGRRAATGVLDARRVAWGCDSPWCSG